MSANAFSATCHTHRGWLAPLLLVVATLAPLGAWGQGTKFISNDITYTVVNATKGDVAVTSCDVTKEGAVTIKDTVIRITALKPILKTKKHAVVTISQFAFRDCTKITSIEIGANVKDIVRFAFLNCASLQAITVAKKNTSWSSQDGVLFNADGTQLKAYPGGKQGDYNVPANVTKINDYAFQACYGITGVSIPAGITTPGRETFNNCSNLEWVSLPASTTRIEANAFSVTPKLTSITCLATKPPSVADASSFREHAKELVIYVPYASLDAYREADYWKDLTIKPIKPTAITITNPETEITLGGTLTMACKVTPDNADPNVKWSTDDKAIATIDEATGELTTHDGGTVVVTVTSAADETVSATREIDVLYAAPTAITINGPAEVTVGETINLKFTVEPKNALQSAKWRVENTTGEATINSIGQLKGVKPGEVIVTATCEADETVKSEAFKVTVKALAPTTLTVVAPTGDIVEGTPTAAFTVTYNPADAAKGAKWSVTNGTGEATIDETTGVLTPTKAGKVTVKATSTEAPDVSGELEVEIKAIGTTPVSSTSLAWCLAVDGLTITIYGAEGQSLEVYNVSGALMHRMASVNASQHQFAVPQPGVYVVRIGNATKKVVVQ